MQEVNLSDLMQIISYSFQDLGLLQTALTHSTFAYENRGVEDNERIEFLGDAILQLVVSEYLFRHEGKLKEGQMTKIRSLLVCEQTLARVAEAIKLSKFLRLGKGEELTGGRKKASNLANSVEAIIGAVYLDGGLAKARQVVLGLLDSYLEPAVKGKIQYDFKSRLLELVQSTRGQSVLNFTIIKEEGPVHNRLFTAAAVLDGVEIVSGEGNSKKEAEQNAAREALSLIFCDTGGCDLIDNLEEEDLDQADGEVK